MSAVAGEKLYICPGEVHPISRSVHLSRLAAFYPGCRDCPLRCDTGHLPPQTLERLQRTESRVERPSLFTAEGVRGIYLNELTRPKSAAIASALAALLWEDAPLMARGEPAGEEAAGRRVRPSVVVGYDERPFSPDLFAGVLSALRRMGCQVIDIGLTTKPCFWFAADHLQAAAGVLVTGAGCESSWAGLDFVARRAQPLSNTPLPGGLDLVRLEARLQQPCSRQSRQAGPQRVFHARVPYEAGLWRHFHALRPLKVVCGTPVPLVWRTLERIFGRLPCRLVRVDVPRRARNPVDAADDDVLRVGRAVRKHAADVGLLIDDDGQRCGVLDEQGTLVPPRSLTRLLAGSLLAESPQAAVVVESSAFEALRPAIEPRGGCCVMGGTTLAAVSHTLRMHDAAFAGGDSGRYWFGEPCPTSDAIVTLAHVLSALSGSDAPFSAVLDGMADA